MRSCRAPLLVLIALSFAACATRGPSLLLKSTPATQPIDSLLQSHPLPPERNIRAVALGATEGLSYHLVQIRDRETPHVHAEHDLVVTLIKGEGELYIGSDALPMRSGDTAVVPRGVRHQFVNLGPEPAAAFVTFAPPYDGSDNVPAD